MKPTLGWTMLSREEMRQAERLTSGGQETRDEIGFLLIHQGFADRFFPGTSVLHTRIRYALFIPWLFQYAAENRTRGSDLGTTINRLMVQLAERLKMREPYDVIGGDKLGQLTSQPPDRVYWTALREWGLLLPTVRTRSEALRRLAALGRAATLDDDGARLDDDPVEVFYNLPKQPSGWEKADAPLEFRLAAAEKDFLRRKLGVLARRGTTSRSLLARLVDAGDTFPPAATPALPRELDARADDEDKQALGIARDAADLSAIGRAVYGALVEHLREADGRPAGRIFHAQLHTHIDAYGESAARCDLEALTMFLPHLPPFVADVLHKTRDYVRKGKPGDFLPLQAAYEYAEVRRKTSARARLANTIRSAARRAEWDPNRHRTTPLHYRWLIVRDMLNDLGGQS